MKQIQSSNAPKAIGPYSQAVLSHGFLFISGQLPVDAKTGQLVQGNMQTLTKKVLENLEAILKAAGLTFASVVRTDVFMTDLKEFAAMNEEYGKAFPGPNYPARQTVQVAALPLSAAIEISCIATTEPAF